MSFFSVVVVVRCVGTVLEPSGSTVSAGHFHSCALRQKDGTYFGGIPTCWGYDGQGQSSFAPGEVVFVQLSAGHLHTCGLGVDELVRCWGRIGSSFVSKTKFSSVSSGEFHACGVAKAGGVLCWGEDHKTGATKPPLSKKALLVAAGKDFSCLLSADDGRGIECWGDDSRSQRNAPEGSFALVAASTSSPHACGLTARTFDLRCWGGALEIYDESVRRRHRDQNRTLGSPAPNYAPPFLEGPFTQLGLGYRTTCVIATSQLRCFGLLAHLLTGSQLADKSLNFQQVSVGRDHICALTDQGLLLCVGQPTASAAHVPPGFQAA